MAAQLRLRHYIHACVHAVYYFVVQMSLTYKIDDTNTKNILYEKVGGI